MSFSKQLDIFVEDTKKEQSRIYRAAVLGLFTRIVMRTPVDKGVLRNNWYVGFGSPNRTTTDRGAPTGGATIKRANDRLKANSTLNLGEPIPATTFISNNLPYANAIEYGHSKQAAEGMVRISLAEWDQIVAAAIASRKTE